MICDQCGTNIQANTDFARTVCRMQPGTAGDWNGTQNFEAVSPQVEPTVAAQLSYPYVGDEVCFAAHCLGSRC